MTSGCLGKNSEEVTIATEAVTRILQLIMKRISFFVPKTDVRQKYINIKKKINDTLVTIAGVRTNSGIKGDSKKPLDQKIGYTQLCQNTNKDNIEPLVAAKEVEVLFDEIMLISEKLIKCINRCFTSSKEVDYEGVAISIVEVVRIIDRIRWYLMRIISGEQISDYEDSPISNSIYNIFIQIPNYQLYQAKGVDKAREALGQFHENLLNRGVPVIGGNGTFARTYTES